MSQTIISGNSDTLENDYYVSNGYEVLWNGYEMIHVAVVLYMFQFTRYGLWFTCYVETLWTYKRETVEG